MEKASIAQNTAQTKIQIWKSVGNVKWKSFQHPSLLTFCFSRVMPGERSDVASRGHSDNTLFSESDSDTQRNGIMRQIAKRCPSEFNLRVRKVRNVEYLDIDHCLRFEGDPSD